MWIPMRLPRRKEELKFAQNRCEHLMVFIGARKKRAEEFSIHRTLMGLPSLHVYELRKQSNLETADGRE